MNGAKRGAWLKAAVLIGTIVTAGCVGVQSTDDHEPKQEKKSAKKHRKGGFDPNAPDGAPEVGDVAPMLTLKTLDGAKKVDLAKFKGQRPVVLIFGSYT